MRSSFTSKYRQKWRTSGVSVEFVALLNAVYVNYSFNPVHLLAEMSIIVLQWIVLVIILCLDGLAWFVAYTFKLVLFHILEIFFEFLGK